MRVSELLVAVRDLVRPAFLFLVVSVGWIGAAHAGAPADLRVTFLVSLSIVGWALFAATLNHVAHRAIDRANLRQAMADDGLPAPIIVTVATVGASVSLAAGALLSPGSLLSALAGLVFAGLYTNPWIRLDGRGVVTSLFVPAVYVLAPFATGRFSTHEAWSASDALLVAGIYVSFVGRLLLKDFRDEHGDRLFGKRTFLVRHGRRATCVVSGCAWVAGVVVLAIARGSWSLSIVWLLLCIPVVLQLKRVSEDEWGVDDVYRITMIAIAGRGILTCLLADISLRQLGAAPWIGWVTQLAVLVISFEAIRRWGLACRSNPARVAPWPVPAESA